MKNLFKGIFKLFMLFCSVVFGFLLIRKLKSKGFLMQCGDPEIDGEEEIDEFTEEIIYKEKAKTPAVSKPKAEPKKVTVKSTTNDLHLSARQKEVLSIIEKNDIVEMKTLQKRIKGVTERTLRRDLIQLQNVGLIKKIGNTKSVKYQLITK